MFEARQHPKGLREVKAIPLFLKQKRAIRRAMLEYLGCALFFLIIGVALIMGHLFGGEEQQIAKLILGIVLLCYALFLFICFVRRLIVFRKFRKAKLSEEQTVSLYCKTVSVLFEAISRSHWVVGCIILVDENGERFYYVYPRNDAPKDADKKQIIKRYAGRDIEVVCYGNSNIIKALPE